MEASYNPEDLTEKWIDQTLTWSDIYTALPALAYQDRIDLRVFKDGKTTRSHEDSLKRVAELIHRIYRWSQGIEPQGMGHFLTAVVENDFHSAVCNADGTNYKALSIYARYFYNMAPKRWRKQNQGPPKK